MPRLVLPEVLYHYTCSHGMTGIRRARKVLPNPVHTLAGAHVAWLTDLAEPDRAGLGLTSQMLTCDRLAYRVTVRPYGAVHWPIWAREHRVDREYRNVLESFGWPMHWWISEQPLAVIELVSA